MATDISTVITVTLTLAQTTKYHHLYLTLGEEQMLKGRVSSAT